MSKSINEIIKESLIDELNANHIKTDDLVKIVEDIKSGFDSVLEELIKEQEFDFQLDDAYFVVNFYGEADGLLWDGDDYDKKALENNAIFKTQEEAEFEAERLKVLRELEKMGRAFRPYGENYSIELEYPLLHKERLSISIFGATQHCFGNYYFDSEEEAKKAIDKIGEERIKKYLFGVED